MQWALIAITAITAAFICWQAWESRKAAGAAKQSGESFVNAERAWILVETGHIPDNFEPDPSRIQILEIRPVVRNRGRTVGRILRGFIGKIEIDPDATLPPEPDYGGRMGNVAVDLVLAPYASVQPMRISLPAEDFISFRRGDRKLYIYGFINYLDIGNQERESRFCFGYYVPHGFASGARGFYQAGDVPSSYTRCT